MLPIDILPSKHHEEQEVLVKAIMEAAGPSEFIT